jgi:hypothetical protein
MYKINFNKLTDIIHFNTEKQATVFSGPKQLLLFKHFINIFIKLFLFYLLFCSIIIPFTFLTLLELHLRPPHCPQTPNGNNGT